MWTTNWGECSLYTGNPELEQHCERCCNSWTFELYVLLATTHPQVFGIKNNWHIRLLIIDFYNMVLIGQCWLISPTGTNWIISMSEDKWHVLWNLLVQMRILWYLKWKIRKHFYIELCSGRDWSSYFQYLTSEVLCFDLSWICPSCDWHLVRFYMLAYDLQLNLRVIVEKVRLRDRKFFEQTHLLQTMI
jgi:hypothetical protein